MKSSKKLLLISIISACICSAIKITIASTEQTQTIPEPAALQQLKTQKQELIKEILSFHDSKLHQHKIKIIQEMAQAKINKQAKANKQLSSEAIPFGTLEYWKRQIAITKIAIEDFQKLLHREKDNKDSSAKIHSDLKQELLKAKQEPGLRNQTLET